MKQFFIRVTMNDSSRWDVPAYLVAYDKAMYYANRAGRSPELVKAVFIEEYEAVFCDRLELFDWAAGNMNWSDVAAFAVQAVPAKVNFDEGWVNGEKDLVSASG